MIRKTTLTILLLVLFASVFSTGAFSVSETSSAPAPLPDDRRMRVELTAEGLRLSFAPAANSAYGVFFFPDGEAAATDARLYAQDGSLAAMGGGSVRLFEARLNAGETYTLVLSGRGTGYVEVMRATLGRSFESPIELDAEAPAYEKLLVRAGDAHWYAFTARQSGPATVYAEPAGYPAGSSPRLRGVLTDETGRVLAEAQSDSGGFAMDCVLEAGARYCVRVSAAEEDTGAYRLGVSFGEEGGRAPESVDLSAQALTLRAGQTYILLAQVSPADAHAAVTFSTSNSAVAAVTQSGEVRALSPGTAVITARAWGGASATCEVTVEGVPLSGIGFSQSELTLRVGESVSAALEFYPADASDRRVRFSVDGSSVVSVSAEGVVTGLSEGTARVTVIALDGGHTDILEVTVGPAAAKLRALIVGQQMYHESVNKVRVGSINTAQSVAAMLETQVLDGESYQTTVLLDSSREDIFLAIRSAFAEAKEGDISLFYITCHGHYAHGMSFFELYDGSLIAARDLERELRKIPGTVVVIADCCGSGGLIGEASSLEDFNRGIVSVFAGRVGQPAFAASKYKVIASASLDQDSYRISFDENVTESDMATVLARALCDGAGWSIGLARRAALRADADYDRRITFNEIAQYAARRVCWYLDVAGELAGASASYVQNVQVYPQGDPFVLLGR
ncbi:MAG TPA: Ig-like domain-containing protein [Candidatus Pullichristensenella avicola]|nr:Ig-like domain-containing protein [Candidatus Pullichristensenella avicola]